MKMFIKCLYTILLYSTFVYIPIFRSYLKESASSVEPEPAFPPTANHQTDKFSTVRQRFATRHAQLEDVCHSYHRLLANTIDFRPAACLPLAENQLTWCSMPKVASTYMNDLFKQIFQLKTTPYASGLAKRRRNPSYVCHPTINKTHLAYSDRSSKSSRSIQHNSNSDQHFTFLFVREPYSRLYSAYLDKVVADPYIWVQLGVHIKSLSSPHTPVTCGHDASFREFVQYFIHTKQTGESPNIHFKPQMDMCDICRQRYDFIGHIETLYEDLDFILQKAGASWNVTIDPEKHTIAAKCRDFVEHYNTSDYSQYYSKPNSPQYKSNYSHCVTLCDGLRQVWWSFHARGLIADHLEFPAQDLCRDDVTGEEFANLALAAHQSSVQSVGRERLSGQKHEHMRSLYNTVSRDTRGTLRQMLSLDFLAFGYDPDLSEVFTESS